MALPRAIFSALQRETVRLLLASSLPPDRAYWRRDFGVDLRHAAALDGAAPARDECASMDWPLVPPRCGTWHPWRVSFGGSFHAAQLWRWPDGACHCMDRDNGDCVGGDCA